LTKSVQVIKEHSLQSTKKKKIQSEQKL